MNFAGENERRSQWSPCGLGIGEPSPGTQSPQILKSSVFLFVRICLTTALLVISVNGVAFGQHGHVAPPPPAPHPSTQQHPQPSGALHPAPQPRPSGQQHLNEWLQKNRALSTQDQARKLQQEQGFKRLPPQQQQRLTNRLQQLNQMPPDQRQRTLERVENMERLSPSQQQQVRGSAARLGQLPADQQQAVRDAMRNLRSVPPGQRQSELNSSRYSQLNPEQRGIVGNLLTVEPYHPAPAPPR